MPRPNTRTVYGPYPKGNRWRLSLVENGKQRTLVYPTREDAERAKAELVIASENAPRLSEALDWYQDHLTRKGWKRGSLATAKFRLRSFFGLDKDETRIAADVPLTLLTADRCKALYRTQTERMKVDTHRNTLTLAKAFGKWCAKEGRLATNPLDPIEPEGRRHRGKEQLRITEARKFIATCEEHGAAGDPGAIAAMTALLLGLRASEVVERVVRDLDDDGRLLWIPVSKTEAGKRTLEVPDSLRAHLKRLAAGKAPTDRLFSRKDRHWVLYHVRRMCQAAGVPEITSHSLRGLHATLATERGTTGRVVAAALGHTSFAMTTKRHYVAAGTVERAAQRQLLETLAPTPKRSRKAKKEAQPATEVVAAAPPPIAKGRPVLRLILGGRDKE